MLPSAVAHDPIDPVIGQAAVECVHPREQLAGGGVMPNCAERAVPAVIVNPNISVRPADHIRGMLSASAKKTGLSLIIL